MPASIRVAEAEGISGLIGQTFEKVTKGEFRIKEPTLTTEEHVIHDALKPNTTRVDRLFMGCDQPPFTPRWTATEELKREKTSDEMILGDPMNFT